MTGGAVENHPLAGPVAHPLAVSSAQPVTFLPEMTLPAKLITMVKIDGVPFPVFQQIFLFPGMAVETAESSGLAMVQDYVAMGEPGAVLSLDLGVGMASAAGGAL